MKAASAKLQTVAIPPVDLCSSDAVNQFGRASRAISKRIQQSKKPRKASREWLIEIGILTPTGRLSKHYQ
jgi:hypothetical protein